VKKRWYLVSLAFISLFLFVLYKKHPQEEKLTVGHAKMKNFPSPKLHPITIKYPSIKAMARIPASKGPKASPPKPILRIPQSEKAFKIGKSHVLLEGVAAVSEAQFNSKLGKKMTSSLGFVFYHPSSRQAAGQGVPVAMNTNNLKLYPLSQIVHIKGVDDTLRGQLKAEGFKEYYYHSRLKLMSIENSPSEILQRYQEFKDRGLKVSLEILKEPYVSK
jgi:hypothetical protein